MILNGNADRFTSETVDRVRAAAKQLGYRPSIAGRALANGTSDIVITLVPDITIGPRLRVLIDTMTDDLARSGYANLLRLDTASESIDSTILGLRPFGVISLGPLPPRRKRTFATNGARVLELTAPSQAAFDERIGALQAQHLLLRGATRIAVALPSDTREMPYAQARERGVHTWCKEHAVVVEPTYYMDSGIGAWAGVIAHDVDRGLGIAAYNDDVALGMLSAAHNVGVAVPDDLRVIGVDNSAISRLARPVITSIDIDIASAGDEIVTALLEGREVNGERVAARTPDPLKVVQGGST